MFYDFLFFHIEKPIRKIKIPTIIPAKIPTVVPDEMLFGLGSELKVLFIMGVKSSFSKEDDWQMLG